jgi:hypothetical protein
VTRPPSMSTRPPTMTVSMSRASARVYRQTATTERWAELGRLVEPAVVEMFTEWYKVPVEAAYSYNAARLSAPPGTNGFDRTRSSEAAAT